MPLVKAKGKSKASVQKAIEKNIAILTNENKNLSPGKKRKHDQVVAIAISYAKKGKK